MKCNDSKMNLVRQQKAWSICGLGLGFDVLCITSGLLFCSAMSMHGVCGASLLGIQV